MATTAIWDVKDNLKRVLDYASNPMKTTVEENDYKYNGLKQAIAYTSMDTKTEKQLYVTGINCSLSSAYQDMSITKRAFDKTDGIVAFHAYQSFLPGEVDAETAHQIGIELAQQMWGDRFEVLVSTHIDKKHYHNHFVINSVSFVDGKKYYDNKENYKKMKKMSDLLCEHYRLHVIREPMQHAQPYAGWLAEKKGDPSRRSLMKEDVDYAIAHSMDMKQFYRHLDRMGYDIKYGKHVAIRPKKTDKRFIRLRNIDDFGNYTPERIEERIYEQSYVHFQSMKSEQTDIRFRFHGNLNQMRKITGFRALYFRYMYLLGILPKHAPHQKRVHFLLREDLLQIDKITQEATLISKKDIKTITDLENCEGKAKKTLEDKLKERRGLYNKVRRCNEPEKKEQLQDVIHELSKEIHSLRKEVMLYEGIRFRSISIKEKLCEIQEEKERELNECRWRDSRSTR